LFDHQVSNRSDWGKEALSRSLRAELEETKMRSKVTRGLLASVLALSLALTACDSDDPDDGGSTTTLAETTTSSP
jgi:hypothetical protein